MRLRLSDYNETGQERLQVEGNMAFHSCLASPVFSPVNTTRHKFYGCRINRFDGSLEFFGNSAIPVSGTKFRELFLKTCENIPKQGFRHIRISRLVRMGQSVPARRCRLPYGCQDTAVILQCVADIVQTQ